MSPTVASSSYVRRRAAALVSALGIAALVLTIAPSAQAAPTVSQVSAQLAKMSTRNEALTEQFNKATIDVKAKQKQAALARIAAAKADAIYASSHNELRSAMAEQYKGSGLDTTAALLTSTSGQNYLDQLATLQMLASRRIAITASLKAAKATADTAQATAATLLKEATAKQAALAAQRKKLAAQQAKYTALLEQLTAAQRATYLTTVGGQAISPVQQQQISSAPVPAPSKAAAIAVQFALAQQGKPYVFAAAGPNAYDCSGLTMAAWGHAGVSLPHFAASQYNYGTHVARSQLEPGDLVFFYNPIGHVAIYIGNGMIVHAPTEGDVVKVVPLSTFDSDYVGATRL